MRANNIAFASLVLVTITGCVTPKYAVVRGKKVERPSFGYTDGKFFAVEHNRAYPDIFAGNRPFYVDDGEFSGNACGLDMHFFSEWYGKLMTIYGGASKDVNWMTSGGPRGVEAQLTVDDEGGGHVHIYGSRSDRGAFPIDIDVSPDKLVAQIGTRHVSLIAQGHYLAGRMEQHDMTHVLEAPYVIYGREMLRTMVPADEAVILLMMISCNSTVAYHGQQLRGFSLVSNAANEGVAPPVGGVTETTGVFNRHENNATVNQPTVGTGGAMSSGRH